MPDPQKKAPDSEYEMKFVCHRWPGNEGVITLALDREYTPEEVERFDAPRNDAPS